MLSLEGKQLGNYDVIKRIRVGGMGAVYEGRQRTAFDRRVAIKVILGDYAADRDMRRRFAREARTIARLHHPHILPLIEFGDEQGILYLVMPFIEGGTLTSYLRRTLPDLSEVAAIYLQLLDAVEYAHEEGLIHRDIKSSNVLMEMRRGGPPYIYLADFGLVRTMRPDEGSQVGKPIPLDQVPGTPHYMAPEQTMGIVTPLTDIYALGVLLYQLLTGNLPYNDPDEVRVIEMHLHAPIPLPSEQDASIPPELDQVVRTAMAKRPEERYRTVGELRSAFRKAIKGPIASVQPSGPIPGLRSATTRAFTREQLLKEGTGQEVKDGRDIVRPAPVVPIAARRRERDEIPVAIRERFERSRERLERVRNTDSMRQAAAGQVGRITEDKGAKRRGRWLPLLLVPILLLGLLLLPQAFGITMPFSGLFGMGNPAAASGATIYVSVQTQVEQDTYLLTALTQAQSSDLAKHVIPARSIQSQSVSGNQTVATSGTQTTAAVPAQGTIQLSNNSDTAVMVPITQVFSTAQGVKFRLETSVQVQGRQNGKATVVEARVIAMDAGAAGNIPAHALDGVCCGTGNNTLKVSNNAPFSGGVDAQTQHHVVQADLDGVQAHLESGLKQQVDQQLQKQLGNDEVTSGQVVYNENVTPDIPVNGQADHVTVTVTIQGSVLVYNRKVAEQVASSLLSQKAGQALNAAFHLQGKIALVGQPMVTGVKDNEVDLSVAVRGMWVYSLSDAQASTWRQSIKGATIAAAQAYLKSQPGVAKVEIHLPANTDHLPTTLDQIKILLAPLGG